MKHPIDYITKVVYQSGLDPKDWNQNEIEYMEPAIRFIQQKIDIDTYEVVLLAMFSEKIASFERLCEEHHVSEETKEEVYSKALESLLEKELVIRMKNFLGNDVFETKENIYRIANDIK